MEAFVYICSLYSADEFQEGRNSCPMLRSCFIGSSHVVVFYVVSALQSIVCLYIFFGWSDVLQIPCWHRLSYAVPHSFSFLNTGGHSIRVLNKRSVSDFREICVLCGWRFLNHLDIVLPYSCDTVGRELYRAILCSLLCPETDWKIHVGKQGYVCILTGFQKGWF